jgi:hypothetical protein
VQQVTLDHKVRPVQQAQEQQEPKVIPVQQVTLDHKVRPVQQAQEQQEPKVMLEQQVLKVTLGQLVQLVLKVQLVREL